jgi:Uma2 family endonuclease
MATVTTIPLLQNGDRLNRLEFERRYEAMPWLKKAELIKGVVYMPAAAIRFDQHGGPQFDLISWMGWYRAATPGVRGGDNSSLRLDVENEPQPDAFLMIQPAYGGRATIDAEGYVTRGPELVGEVSASSVSYDLHDKLDVYREHGVQEYIVWRVLDKAIDWLSLHRGSYKPLALRDTVIRSKVFPGLWLHPKALIQGDMAEVAKIAQRGLASAEHAAFVKRLERVTRRGTKPKRGRRRPNS